MFRMPKLTRTRIILALAIAVSADSLQFFLGPLGWAPVDQVIDLIAFVLTAWALGVGIMVRRDPEGLAGRVLPAGRCGCQFPVMCR